MNVIVPSKLVEPNEIVVKQAQFILVRGRVEKDGEYEIAFVIESGEVRGVFPPRALRLVRTWVDAHRDELLICWNAAQRGLGVKRIALGVAEWTTV